MVSKGINSQVLNVKLRLANLKLTQVDLVAILYKTGKYKSLSSLTVQMNYLMTGKRFNSTSQKILDDTIMALDGIESGQIKICTLFNS